MARDGSGTTPHPFGSTGSASPPALFRDVRVVLVECVAVFAGRAFAAFLTRNRSAKPQPPYIEALFWLQNIRKRQPLSRSCYNAVGFQAREVGQFCGHVLHAINHNLAAVMQIPLLLLFRRPSTVFRRIPDIVVNAVNGQPVRSRRHILHEVPKPSSTGHNPSVTHFDAAPAISGEGFIARIIAAVYHTAPCTV